MLAGCSRDVIGLRASRLKFIFLLMRMVQVIPSFLGSVCESVGRLEEEVDFG